MRRWLVASLALCLVGCGECAHPGDVLVAIAPNPDVQASYAASLEVSLRIDDGTTVSREVALSGGLPTTSSFVLTDLPRLAAYRLNVTIMAKSAGGFLVATGASTQIIKDKSCNRMTVVLAAVPFVPPKPTPDMTGMEPPPPAPEMGLDMSPPMPDMSDCSGGMPDEDRDGLADYCDRCPADPDPTPTDADGDGLPDACDPDPMAAGNQLIYFEPFNGPTSWSRGIVVRGPDGGYFDFSSNGADDAPPASNAKQSLPVNVRAQAAIEAQGIRSSSSSAATGLYLTTRANPGDPMASGMLCQISYSVSSGNRSLDFVSVDRGILQLVSSTPLPQFTASYRLRMVQRGSEWTCEVANPDLGSASLKVNLSAAPTSPLYMALRAKNTEVQVYSVVAETALPPPAAPQPAP